MPLTTLLLVACAHRVSALDTVDWDLNPGEVQKEVRVAPVIVAAEAPRPDLTGIVGEELRDERADGRLHRTAQIAELPHAVHAAVPGALNASLRPEWSGHFRDTRLPVADLITLTNAVNGQASLAETLSEVARECEGDAVLFTWIIEAGGRPLTDQHLVGELVFQNGVPVLVDHHSEPYAVEAVIGMALVTTEGEILFRYQDHYENLLVADASVDSLGRRMAKDLVADIVPLWLDDPGESGPWVADSR